MNAMDANTKRVIAVAGCKGGVGKTVVAVNLALALAKLGQRVMLMDGNLAVPDVGITLGLEKPLDIGDLSSGLRNVDKWSQEHSDDNSQDGVVLEGPSGIKVYAPASQDQWRECIQINDAVQLIAKMDALAPSLDTLIVDTAPGLAPDNVTLIQAATEVLIIVNQEVVSLMDTVKQIRLLYRVFNVHQFYIVVNAASSRRCGSKQFEKLQNHLNDEKQIVLSYLGSIPFDKAVNEALAMQSALLTVNPECRASRAFHRLGHQIASIPVPEPRGRIEFFLPTRIRERVKS